MLGEFVADFGVVIVCGSAAVSALGTSCPFGCNDSLVLSAKYTIRAAARSSRLE